MPADAASLHCPNCGAPAEPDAGRCRYCKARLATISCPSCFALMFEGTTFCPRCGGRRNRTAAEPVATQCPGCRATMRLVDVGAASLLECDACDGIWMDAASFEALCADREAQAAVVHRFGGRHAAGAERVKYRPCARCGKMMNRLNFGRLSGVIVDVCKGHGTYLDPGELHLIVQFIQGGGMERARLRQLEELKEKERELRDREARLARDRGRADPHGSIAGWDRWTFMIGE